MKITSNGIELNVSRTERGGPTFVFLHFWGGSSRTWTELVSRVSADHDCVALDARGQGESDAPEEGYSIRELAADALGVIGALGLDRYVLVGHSMGGKTAQLIASQRPPGLVGLALIASSPPSPMEIPDEQRAQMKLAYSSLEAATWTFDHVLLGSAIEPAIRERALEDALRVSPAAVKGWVEIGTRDDISSEVARVDVPVVIVAGELDRVDPVEVVRHHIAPYYPQALVSILPGKGHLLPLEAPQELADILQANFSQVSRSSDGR